MRTPACVDTAEFYFRCSSPRSGGRPISTQQQDGAREALWCQRGWRMAAALSSSPHCQHVHDSPHGD
ncbi:MAG: hypothetical protein Q8P67_20140 [archaeon]|nr:hypothetical protein [archaeon]